MKSVWLSYLTIAVGILVLLFQPFIEKQLNLTVFSPRPNQDCTIVIDPGHGGEDGGATGVTGVLEKGINLSISEKVRDVLNFYGFSTVMTRTEDVSIHDEGNSVRKRKVSDIKNRVKCVEKSRNPILLSVHLNFFPQENCRGAQVFYSSHNDRSKELAEKMQQCLKNGMDDANNRTIKKADKNLYLLNNVSCPAVLAECGFLSNPNEESLLVTDEYQKKLAACISAGFFQYIS